MIPGIIILLSQRCFWESWVLWELQLVLCRPWGHLLRLAGADPLRSAGLDEDFDMQIIEVRDTKQAPRTAKYKF